MVSGLLLDSSTWIRIVLMVIGGWSVVVVGGLLLGLIGGLALLVGLLGDGLLVAVGGTGFVVGDWNVRGI
jgi:hypothetical protein